MENRKTTLTLIKTNNEEVKININIANFFYKISNDVWRSLKKKTGFMSTMVACNTKLLELRNAKPICMTRKHIKYLGEV